MHCGEPPAKIRNTKIWREVSWAGLYSYDGKKYSGTLLRGDLGVTSLISVGGSRLSSCVGMLEGGTTSYKNLTLE
jgi:hypothetical protein